MGETMEDLMTIAKRIRRGLERRGVPARIEAKDAATVFVCGTLAGEDFRWRVRILTVAAGSNAIN
jgi:hypothetical protein